MTRSLLLIDDDAAELEITNHELSQAGIRATCRLVTDEQQLADALAHELPALILCDIVLPEWDCWQALRTCRRLAPGVPFALVSHAVGVEDARRAMQRGVFGTADKGTAEFLELVKRAMRMQLT